MKKGEKMKKFLILLTLIAVCISCFSCGCEHDWIEATCKSPKICSMCEKTQGKSDSSQHKWNNPTCITPKKCTLCGETEGTIASVHNYENDKCRDCGLIKLTMYNFEDYIECNATVKSGEYFKDGYFGYVYQSLQCIFEARGNTHYKYNDVSVVVQFCHYDLDGYLTYLGNNLEMLTGAAITTVPTPCDEDTNTVKLNIAGNGSYTCELDTSWRTDKGECNDISTLFDRTIYKIVSVSGTVQEY